MDDRHGKRDLGLTLIAVGKLLKAVVILAVAVAALVISQGDPPQALVAWADALGVDPGNRWFLKLFGKVAGMDSRKLEAVGAGSFVYAAVFAAEGIGLWLRKKWAEYLTVIVTVSFIPIEIYEMTRHFSAGKLVVLILNVAVVVYLVVRLWAGRRQKSGSHARGQLQPT